ncbi:hypothetical protein B0T16DRAFT_400005 [Cercophora newfieldiana]|uniref:Uncharacterized protein n=1 Tax=Cercophora newfieldiana TaxID=92897 RepID=A0AA39YS54_9PEZI|nr:hypothetical protein B0T16DRAFT_400005 [Cercophora newfieldiana]
MHEKGVSTNSQSNNARRPRSIFKTKKKTPKRALPPENPIAIQMGICPPQNPPPAQDSIAKQKGIRPPQNPQPAQDSITT